MTRQVPGMFKRNTMTRTTTADNQQLLQRQAHCLRLQGPEGDPRIQAPRDLGQGHQAARYAHTPSNNTTDEILTMCTGNSGVVRAKFAHPLPSKSFGASVRVMLYPSSI